MAGTGVFAEVLDGEVYKYYADGEWRASASGKTVAIVNPTTRQTQYKVQGMLHLLLPPLVYLFSPATRT
jgi:glyceraldehyde-3-phosphate dehydrogenase (NADP+)